MKFSSHLRMLLGLKPGETPKFLQGVIKPDQLDAIRKQSEAVQPDPEQLKQLELMAQRLQQALAGVDSLPAAPAPKLVPPKPFIP